MNKSELYVTLATFTPEEITRFRKYLQSPFFNSSSRLLSLYIEIVKFYPKFSHPGLSREKLAKKIYPDNHYNDATIRNLFSDLHEAALHYLSIENFERSKLGKYYFMFGELRVKGLDHDFSKIAGNISSDADQVDWIYFLNYHLLEINKFNFSHLNRKFKKAENISSESAYVRNSLNNLIYFFVVNFISITLDFMSFEDSYNTGASRRSIFSRLELINFDALEKLLGKDKHFFIVELYLKLVNTFEDLENDSHYNEYKSHFFKHINKLSRDEISFHYYRFLSRCAYKILLKPNEVKYDLEMFTLYNEFLKNEYYLDRNSAYISYELFRNILRHGLKLKEFSWVSDFIDTYSVKVNPQDIENMRNYGYAYLSYSTGNYRKALDHINKINAEYFIYKIDLKNLTLMIFYELEYTEEALSLIRTYRESIRKNTMVHPERRKRYQNFVKYLEKLILIKAGTLDRETGYIKLGVMQKTPAAFKPWLLEKTMELKKKQSKAV